jgi:sorting nexin-3/12
MQRSKYNFGSQSAEDRYGVPENFLEIEVRDPQIQGDTNKFIDYEIVCRVYGFH